MVGVFNPLPDRWRNGESDTLLRCSIRELVRDPTETFVLSGCEGLLGTRTCFTGIFTMGERGSWGKTWSSDSTSLLLMRSLHELDGRRWFIQLGWA